MSGAPKSVFNDSELDQFLFDIDEDEALTSRTQLRGPFGVFASNDDAPEATLSSPTQSHVSLDYASEEGNASQFLPDEQGYVHDAARQYLGLSRRTSTASYMSEYDGMWPALPPGARVFPSPSPSFLQLLESQFPVMTPAMVDDPPIEDDADFPSPSDSFALVSQPSPFFMKPETRFLLNHYIHQVVNIFTMVENAKSPWKSIHLPRAMQGSGELEVIGATSHTRKALLNAILSVSAYCLSNRYGHGQVDQMEKWRSVGHQLRFQAVKSLQTCVTENISSSSKPKYKELLAAMLSMVSIDVASGETSTCLMHLAGSESFIRSTKGWKMKYSSKARSLHRIFYYLRVIHASTKSVEISKDESASPPVKTVSDEKPTAKSWLEDDLANSEEQASSTEFIYGIPPSLLVLLGKATDIVQQLDHVRRAPHELDNATASRLADACDQLEAEILDWPVDSALSCLQDLTPETRSIIEHQTRAFHQAIVIYFSSHVRAMHSRYMKPYVEAVISHAEAIEEIKRQHKVTSGPLFWPCFIAAAEAVDEDLQQRFIRWYDKTQVYGLAGGLMGRDIVTEVWRRRRSGCSREASSWRKVMENQQVCLMLT